MQELGDRWGVQVVRRMSKLESLDLRGIVRAVRQWQGREGVIVKLQSRVVVKVKSAWWFQAGHDRQRSEKATEWRAKEKARTMQRRQRCQLRSQRVAIVGWQMGVNVRELEMMGCLPEAQRVEAVYNKSNGRLRVVIASFGAEAAAQEMLGRKLVCGGRVLQVQQAYNNRTRESSRSRVEVVRAD